jgi:polyphosphate kinase
MSQTAAQSKSKLPDSIFYNRDFLFNRELSWLEFNRRVLAEALDEKNLLLERLKFLSIFSTNLDEFFMIRVSGLKEQIEKNVRELSPDGMSPGEQLREIRASLLPMIAEQMTALRENVFPALAKKKVVVESYEKLNAAEKAKLNDYFFRNVFPVLTPQAVDASHPFPYISNLSLNLGVVVEPIEVKVKHLGSESRFARIKLPGNIPRLIQINEGESRYTLLGELIRANISELFPGMRLLACNLFRVTRDADIEIREDEAGDLLKTMEQELHRRRFRFPVRLEVEASMPDTLVANLTERIGLTANDVYKIDGFLNTPDLMQLYSLDRDDLKDKPIPMSLPNLFHQRKSIFESIREQDILLHHPYTSYNAVTDFINSAADDVDVQAIKICLYRTGKNSPIVEALVRASEQGKQVTALVELKARFDEENNIEWARRLESEGVHVIYGMHGLKTHSKVALVVRRESDELRRYVHIATGNYNPTTSRIYTDLGLLTCNRDIASDASDLFNFLTGFSQQTEYNSLLVAPVNMRQKLIALISREKANVIAGKSAKITLKVNSLTDIEMIHSLYEASQAGVKIDLIVRGICMLRPNIKGISENINIISIVGRFLEHSRVFYFENAGEPKAYIGSADLMQRNLNRRVEVIVPIQDTRLRDYIRNEILDSYLLDNTDASQLQNNGEYLRIAAKSKAGEFNSQTYFIGKEIV